MHEGSVLPQGPSTPRDQSTGVLDGIEGICRRAGIARSDVRTIVHGTTIATNITIEHDGAEVGMLTTRGLRGGLFSLVP